MKQLLLINFSVLVLTMNIAIAQNTQTPDCPSVDMVKAIPVSTTTVECINHYLSSGHIGITPGEYLLSASFESSLAGLSWRFELGVQADTKEEATILIDNYLASLTKVSPAQGCCFKMHWSCTYYNAQDWPEAHAHTIR